jgi:hypothetical protein
MKNSLMRLVVLVVGFGLMASSVCARELSNYELLERITALESQLGGVSVAVEQNSSLESWANRITLSGVIEVEVGYENIDYDDPTKNDEDSSDITLATVELGVDVAITDHVSGSVLLLFEEGEGSIDIDEAFIMYDGEEDNPLFARGGMLYVPFGDFSSNMISDPLTLEVGETRDSAVEVGFNHGGFYSSVYVFNGDIDEAGDDSHIDNFGVNVGYGMESDDFSMDFGMSYINNILDSDGLGDDFEDKMAEAEDAGALLELDEYVGGFGAHVVVGVAGFSVIGEYIAAMDDPEYVLNGVKEEVEAFSAWNMEVGYTFEFSGRETTVGIAYQGSDDADNFIAETRYMGVVSVAVVDGTSLAVEYLHDEFENDDEADVITAQLAIEF